MKIVYLFPNINQIKSANRIQTQKFSKAMADKLGRNFVFISANGYEDNSWHIQIKYHFNKAQTIQFIFHIIKRKLIVDSDTLYIRDYKLLKIMLFLKKIGFISNNIIFEVHEIPQKQAILKSILQSNRLVAISQTSKNKLIKLGYQEKSILVAHDGFDTNEQIFKIENSLIDSLNPNNTIVYTGSYSNWKNIEFIIEIANNLGNINFLFVGLDKSKLLHCNISSNIYFLDYVEHKYIYSILNRFNYAILSLNMNYEISNYTSPLKLFEYLSSGLTIFVPNVENIKEIIEDGYNGYLYEFNIAKTSKLISKIIDEKKIFKKELIKESVKKYSWTKRADLVSKWIIEND